MPPDKDRPLMHVFISVGEPSGDLHASKLIAELRRHRPELQISGFGGPLMEQQGFENLFRLTDLAVMGILLVLPLLGKFLRLLWQARRYLRTERPDLVVLVDCPGFNWWIARFARGAGIPVVYYLPPQLWAWGSWRIRRVRKYVDRVLACLPFEFDWYRARGVHATYVGHPFFDDVASRPLDHNFLDRFDRAVDRGSTGEDRGVRISNLKSQISNPPVVAILPGSRNAELDLNFDLQLEIIARLHHQNPGLRFLVACYKDSQQQTCERHWRAFAERQWPNDATSNAVNGPPSAVYRSPSIEFHVGKTSEIIEVANVCLMVSGSVSLEVLARGTPAVVQFHISRVDRLIGRLVLTCDYISLPNLIAGREVFPEFLISGDVEPALREITATLNGWLTDPRAHREKVAELDQLRRHVCVAGATQRAAEAVLECLPADAMTFSPARAA
jgi:lipid-A-disaccharide synthase